MCIFNPASLDLNILEFGKVKLDEKKVFVQVKNQIEHKVFFSSNGSTRYYFLVYLNFDPIWISLTLALEVSQFQWFCFGNCKPLRKAFSLTYSFKHHWTCFA
jgi:hypothetical protein